MTPEQRGCYIQLLARAWPDGIPYDAHASAMLWALASMPSAEAWDKIKAPVVAQFEEREGRLVNVKLDEQYKALESYRSMAVTRGKKGAEGRWGKKDASSIPQALLGDGSPSPSVSSSSSASSSSSSTARENSTVQDGADSLTGVSGSKTTEKHEGHGKRDVHKESEIYLVTKEALWGLAGSMQDDTPDILYGLVAQYGIDDIAGVYLWMDLVNKDRYWSGRVSDWTDFKRCYPKMYQQFVKCGGHPTAVKAYQRERKKTRGKSYDEMAAEAVAKIIPESDDYGETFSVEDVPDKDGLE